MSSHQWLMMRCYFTFHEQKDAASAEWVFCERLSYRYDDIKHDIMLRFCCATAWNNLACRIDFHQRELWYFCSQKKGTPAIWNTWIDCPGVLTDTAIRHRSFQKESTCQSSSKQNPVADTVNGCVAFQNQTCWFHIHQHQSPSARLNTPHARSWVIAGRLDGGDAEHMTGGVQSRCYDLVAAQ